MAHTKAGGATRQQGNRRGKRLGVKVFGGQRVINGNIVVRQKGSRFHAGAGVKTGRDFTLYAIKSGTVQFGQKLGRQVVSIVEP